MATVTGASLVAGIESSTGVTLNAVLKASLTAKLQQMIDKGTYSATSAAVAIQAFSSQIKTVVDANGGTAAFVNNVTAVKTAVENGTTIPTFGSTTPTNPTFTLTTGADTPALSANNDTITGVVSALSSENTLNALDKIDGLAGVDTIKLNVSADFAGFTAGSGYLKNVEVVELTNAGSIGRSFAAKGVTDVTDYVIKGDLAGVNLTDLATIPTSVAISGQKSGSSSIAFATDVTKGTADAMTLKLDGVGTAEVQNASGAVTTAEAAVTVTASGIETLTLNTANTVVAALADSGTSGTSALKVAGAGNTKLTAIQSGVKTVDAGAATGSLDINLGSGSGITSLTGGSANDTFRAGTGNLTVNAKIVGGAGQDVLATSATGTVQYDMSGVETVQLSNTGALTFSATKTTGLEKIVVTKDASATASFVGLGSSALTVDLQKTNTNADLTVDTSGAVTANAQVTSAATKAVPETIAGDIIASNASSLTLNVAQYGVFTGTGKADKATELTVKVDGQLSGAVINAAKATGLTITDTNADTAETVTLTTPELKSLSITAAGAFTASSGSSLTKVETLTVSAGKGFTASGNNLDAINKITLSGANTDSAVTLANLGATGLGYGITLDATGLKGGLTVGKVDAGAGQAIALNVSGVTGAVSIGSGSTVKVAQSNSADTGSITVNAKNVGGAVTLGTVQAKTVSVDVSAVAGAVNVAGLTGDTITFNAASALGAVTMGTVAVKTALTYTGAELTTNTATIDIQGTDVNLFLKGGLQGDTFTVNSFATNATTAQKLTATGDLGLDTDTVNIDLNGATGTGGIEINLSGLKADVVNVISAASNLAGGNFTYTGVDGSDIIDLSALAIAHTTGQVKINLFAADGDADQIKFGSAVAAGTVHKAFEITGFEAGNTGSDVISFKNGLLTYMTNATTAGAATNATTVVANEISKGSFNATEVAVTTADKVIYEISGSGDVAAGKGTIAADIWSAIAGNSTATFSGAADTAVSKLFVVDDGTDSYLWVYKSADATASSDDIQLIGIVKGVTDFANGDFNIIA